MFSEDVIGLFMSVRFVNTNKNRFMFMYISQTYIIIYCV